MFDKLAEELKAARLRNSLTIKQLATKTRIDLKFLEAMEEGNFSFMPDLYVKAFIKEYANSVGLDVEKTLKKYDRSKEGLPFEEETFVEKENTLEENLANAKEEPKQNPIEEIHEKPEEKQEEKVEKFKEVSYSANQSNSVYSKPIPTYDSTATKISELAPNNRNLIIISSIIGGAIIIIGLIYLIFFTKSNEIVVPEKPYDEVISETQQRYKETTTTADSVQKNTTLADSLDLLIQATDTSWVRIILDDTSAEEFILFPNSQKSIKAADNFKITFGRSSAIKLKLDSKPLDFNPKSRIVSHVMINAKGLEFLKEPPTLGGE
jgi:cytoskeletal protein RodZ